MKKGGYKQWIKIRNLKNLKRRTLKKERLKTKRRGYSLHQRKNKTLKEIQFDNKKKRFSAPEIFSFIENPTQTIEFFDKILSYLSIMRNNKKEIFFDISNIQRLTIDALMYLIAIVNNISENYKLKYSFSGNFPKNEKVMKLLKESGFLNYVKTNKPIINKKVNENIQIRNGYNSNTDTVKSIIDFLAEKSSLKIIEFSDLYEICIELMSNTFHHAYNNNSILAKVWYLFVEREDNIVKLSFIDVGNGITNTIRKKFTEKIKILGLTEDSKYIMSALKGEFRTRTNLKYRNKGLPTVYKYSKKKEVRRLEIISEKGIYKINENGKELLEDLETPLQGTLYYWEIDLNKLEGDKYDTNKNI